MCGTSATCILSTNVINYTRIIICALLVQLVIYLKRNIYMFNNQFWQSYAYKNIKFVINLPKLFESQYGSIILFLVKQYFVIYRLFQLYRNILLVTNNCSDIRCIVNGNVSVF